MSATPLRQETNHVGSYCLFGVVIPPRVLSCCGYRSARRMAASGVPSTPPRLPVLGHLGESFCPPRCGIAHPPGAHTLVCRFPPSTCYAGCFRCYLLFLVLVRFAGAVLGVAPVPSSRRKRASTEPRFDAFFLSFCRWRSAARTTSFSRCSPSSGTPFSASRFRRRRPWTTSRHSRTRKGSPSRCVRGRADGGGRCGADIQRIDGGRKSETFYVTSRRRRGAARHAATRSTTRVLCL